MCTDATSVWKGMLPVSSTTEPNSPIARAKARATPDRMARSRLGRMMRRTMAAVAAAGDGVDQRHHQRGSQSELEGGQGIRGGYRPPEDIQTAAGRLPENGGQRQQDHQAEVGEDATPQQAGTAGHLQREPSSRDSTSR